MRLTNVVVDGQADPIEVRFEWDGDLAGARSVLWTIWLARADGSGGRQLGYKIVDGEFSAHYVFDSALARQENLTDHAANLAGRALSAEFPASALEGFGDMWTWYAVLNVNGDDVDKFTPSA